MHKAFIAKLFMNGRSQAVRLPKEFRFEGDRVRVQRVGRGVLLEPMRVDVKQWLVELHALGQGEPFPEPGPQPRVLPENFFD